MTQFEKNPNPTKDQHFMVDKNMLEHICQKAEIRPGETIVEIGGGAGALTEYLANGENYVTVIEKDPYYAKLLKEKFSERTNVKVIEGDALEHDFFSYDRIVANLPYTITEPFLVNLAKKGVLGHNPKDAKSSNVKSITLVLSQNSVRKMIAPIQITDGKCKHFNQEFGIMGAICHTFLEVDVDTAIPSEAFFPAPAVTSFVVNLVPKKRKTTVDRIMTEMLTDRKGISPSINRVYQMMLVQGKVYNLKKYKHDMSKATGYTTCTSKIIGSKNIYELTNAQLSQLLQDLIRNDSKIKGERAKSIRQINDPYELFKQTGEYEEDFEEVEIRKTKAQKKAEDKYSYLYDERRYNVLLKRGLEYIKPQEFKQMLAEGI